VLVLQGKVKWFNNDKGYGFVDYKDNEDIFVHYSAIKQDGFKTLSEGQLVQFDLIETDKGLQAVNVVEVETTTV
jgi:CspA family cold shock protein